MAVTAFYRLQSSDWAGRTPGAGGTLYFYCDTEAERPSALAIDGDTASTASNGATRAVFKVEGILRNGANAGTLIARAKREAVGTGPNVRAGSFGRLWQIS